MVSTVSHEPVTLSVVVTFFNQRAFVADALESLLAQSREDVEIIAVDDGSGDGTSDVLRRYDDRVKVLLLAVNQGISGARNSGAAHATGDYLIFLDGDDAFLPWALDVYSTIGRARRPVVIIGSLQWFAGELPRAEERPPEVQFIEYRYYFMKDRSLGAHGVATAVDTRFFRQVGGWGPELPVCEDYDLMWRLGLSGPVVYVTDPPTVLHRAHAGQTTQQRMKMLEGVERLVALEKSDRYPGRGLHALERKACVGGFALQWALALRNDSRGGTARLLARSWLLVLVAIAVRATAVIRGRRPIQTIELERRREPLRSST
jgi:GT2 family glycosyltransferase